MVISAPKAWVVVVPIKLVELNIKECCGFHQQPLLESRHYRFPIDVLSALEFHFHSLHNYALQHDH